VSVCGDVMQATLTGKEVEMYFCIHCDYHGYHYVEEGKFKVCPYCRWVVYSESEIKRGFLGSNLYPKMVSNYKKVKREG